MVKLHAGPMEIAHLLHSCINSSRTVGLIGGLLIACSATPNSEQEQAVARQAITGPATVCDTTNMCTLSWTVPANVPPKELAIASSSVARVNDGASVVSYDNVTTPVVAGVGTYGGYSNRMGVLSSIGHLFATAAVELADRSIVMGTIKYANTISIGNNVVIAADLNGVSAIPTKTISLGTTQWPSNYTDAQIDASGQASKTARNQNGQYYEYYPSIKVEANGSLTLNPGNSTYTDFFTDALDIESHAKLIINTANNKFVRLFINSTAQPLIHGQVLEDQGSNVDLTKNPVRSLLAYFGTSPVMIEDQFNGLYVAPNADLGIQGWANNNQLTHRGAFFAHYVELHQNSILKAGFNPALVWNPNDPLQTQTAPQETLQKYVAHLGFLDGSDCNSWPQALTPSNYVNALITNLGDNAADVAWLNSQMTSQGISQITAIGSPRELIVTSYAEPSSVDLQPSRRWVAIDSDANAAYDLSFQRLCTLDDLKNDRCSTKGKQISAVIAGGATTKTYELLGLTAPRERSPSNYATFSDSPKSVLLVAPKVHFQPPAGSEDPNRVDLNVNLIV